MAVKGFFEDHDDQVVLSDIRNFKDTKDFIKQAEQYMIDTRGYRVPVIEPTVENIVFNDEEWKPAEAVEKNEFEGTKITVYSAELNWQTVINSI